MPINSQLLILLKNNDSSVVSLDLSHQALHMGDIQILIENLKGNSYLTTLSLTGNQIGDEGAVFLAKYLVFLNLNLCGTGLGEAAAVSLAKHPNIISLDISHNKINDDVVAEFVKNTRIETLNLAGNKITCLGAIALARNKTLRSLNLMGNFVADSGASCLAQNNTLTFLNLAVNNITDSGAIALANNSTLTSLVLHHNKIDKEGARAFSKNTQLLELDLGNNKIGTDGAVFLSKNITLISLYLPENSINNLGIIALVKNSNFKRLHLSYNRVSDESAAALGGNKTLEELDLSYNLLGPKTAMIAAQHPKLRWLSLNYNVVESEGAIALGSSTSIECLNLEGNHIGPESAVAFANNKKLKTLKLSTNFLNNESAIALSKNKTLVELLLSYNQIGDEGAIALAQNQTLKLLSLSYNYIQEKGRKALMENKTLKSLFLAPGLPQEITTESLTTLISLSQDFMCLLGKNGIIQFFNPHFVRVLGHSGDELLTKSINDLLHPEDKMKGSLLIEGYNKLPILLPSYRYACKGGFYRWIQWSCQFKKGCVFAVGIDVTEEKSSQEQLIYTEQKRLEDYFKRQTEFIAHLCHEIRNPLNGIYGNLVLIQENIRDLEVFFKEKSHLLPPDVLEKVKQFFAFTKENLNDIEACADYEKNILDDNLDIARIAENKLRLTNEAIDIKKILSEVCRMFKVEADKKGLVLELKLSNEELVIKGDNLRIKQIATNLIINAIKFTEKGRIDVFLNIKSKTPLEIQLEISVHDTGIGLNEQEINKLFERFSLTVTSPSKYTGAALGLVISKQLAILMGGDITVESQKGKGSIFRCMIWCEKLQHQEENKRDLIVGKPVAAPFLPLYSLPQPLKKPKILVVDDVDINRKLLVHNLQKANYTCLEASNGEDTLKIFKTTPEIDIIFMDIVMPGIDGLETTRRIRHYEKEQQLPSVFIVAVSGNALESQVQEALQAGINNYITKPYKKEEIFKMISGWRPPVAVPDVSASPIAKPK
jgi:PAS domain S-box-containing protein